MGSIARIDQGVGRGEPELGLLAPSNAADRHLEVGRGRDESIVHVALSRQ